MGALALSGVIAAFLVWKNQKHGFVQKR